MTADTNTSPPNIGTGTRAAKGSGRTNRPTTLARKTRIAGINTNPTYFRFEMSSLSYDSITAEVSSAAVASPLPTSFTAMAI